MPGGAGFLQPLRNKAALVAFARPLSAVAAPRRRTVLPDTAFYRARMLDVERENKQFLYLPCVETIMLVLQKETFFFRVAAARTIDTDLW